MNNHEEFYAKVLQTIEESNNKQTRDITEQIKIEIRAEVEELKNIIRDEINKRTQLEAKYDNLKLKYEALEKSLRKNNIIIFGLENKTENLLKYTVDQLNHFLGLNLTIKDINDVFTIGKQKERRPIIVKFISYITKQEVLKSCKKLKGTNITISEELNLEERKRNKILRQHLKEARSKKYNAHIKGDKLYVNDKAYTAEELINNEEDTDSEDNYRKETENEDLPKNPQATTSIQAASKQEGTERYDIVENETKKRKITAINKPLTRTTTAATIIGRNTAKDNEKSKGKGTPGK